MSQQLTTAHNSHTCQRGINGQPCEMCAAANEREARELARKGEEKEIRVSEDEKGLTGLESPGIGVVADGKGCCDRCEDSDQQELELSHQTKTAVLAEMKQDQNCASLTTIRAAIFDAVDGDEPYALYGYNETANDEERCRLVDTVVARIAQLQREPHFFDANLLSRLSDVRAQYKRGYADGWADGRSDATKTHRDDLQEIQRMVGERK